MKQPEQNTNVELKQLKAKAINKLYKDPERRRKAHEFQCKLNEELDECEDELQRMELLRDKMQELNTRLDQLVQDIRGLL